MKLQGMLAFAATPFDSAGSVYRAKVRHNFEKWNRTALAGFIVGAHPGEGPLLSVDEKFEIMTLASPLVPEARALILDVSSEGVTLAANLARRGAEAGARAVVSVVPHEYRNLMCGPATQGMYFRALADRSPVPVLVHNAPLTTGVDLAPDTIFALAQHPNIGGLIESGTPVARIRQLKAGLPKDFAVLAGSEAQTLESLKAGANGAVLAFASAAPYATIAIWEAFRTREEEAALDWQARIAHPAVLVTDVYGVAGLKHAMDLNGYYGGPPRLPFAPVSPEARLEIEEAFRDLRA